MGKDWGKFSGMINVLHFFLMEVITSFLHPCFSQLLSLSTTDFCSIIPIRPHAIKKSCYSNFLVALNNNWISLDPRTKHSYTKQHIMVGCILMRLWYSCDAFLWWWSMRGSWSPAGNLIVKSLPLWKIHNLFLVSEDNFQTQRQCVTWLFENQGNLFLPAPPWASRGTGAQRVFGR